LFSFRIEPAPNDCPNGLMRRPYTQLVTNELRDLSVRVTCGVDLEDDLDPSLLLGDRDWALLLLLDPVAEGGFRTQPVASARLRAIAGPAFPRASRLAGIQNFAAFVVPKTGHVGRATGLYRKVRVLTSAFSGLRLLSPQSGRHVEGSN
jgi:hypothetical protein